MTGELRVTVPCSTSNLGAGFDCIGLAFDRHLTATFEPGGDRIDLVRLGTLAELPHDAHDIVADILTARSVFGALTLNSTIPVGKGLGSSAAATVAALAIASAIAHEDFDCDIALEAATALEGHPDNSAPAIIGGLVAVVTDGTRRRALHLHLSEDIGFVFAAPHATVSTKAARRALPDHVAHGMATRTVARTVALVEGLAEGDAELLRIGFEDELHVPYRIGMIPGGAHALAAARQAGAWAATISGSGSGMIAVCAPGDESAIVAAMRSAFEAATAHDAIAFVVTPDFDGVQVQRPM